MLQTVARAIIEVVRRALRIMYPGHKHPISNGQLKDATVAKKSKTSDIEDLNSPSVESRMSEAASQVSAATDVLSDSCPGFFPGCGSVVPCDECTDKNRFSVLLGGPQR